MIPHLENMARTLKPKDSKSPSSPTVKEGAGSDGIKSPSPDSKDVAEKASAAPPVKKSRKRKAVDDDTATEAPSPKKPKKAKSTAETASPPKTRKRKAVDDAATEPPSPKKPRKAKPKVEKTTSASPPKTRRKRANVEAPPPPAISLPLTKMVSDKIAHVKRFLNDHYHGRFESTLDRDPSNSNLTSVPKSWLLAALTTMRMQYEVDAREKAPTADVDGAIVNRFESPFGHSWKPIDWVTVDISKRSELQSRIHEKIKGRGLEDVGLLEVELELQNRRELLKDGMIQDDHHLYAERFLSFFETAWNKISAPKPEPEATVTSAKAPSEMCGERKLARVDSCVAPAKEFSVGRFLKLPAQGSLSY